MIRLAALALILVPGLSVAQLKLPSFSSPPSKVTLLTELSSNINERDFALSPDGTEIFYTISTPRSSFQTIVFSKKSSKGEWSSPEVAPFAGEYSDLEPVFSYDGNTLFFASNRPITGTGRKDFDLWKVTRTTNGWSKPENLGPVINSSGDEFYPSIARNGNLYFTAQYEGGPGNEDIWMSEFRNNQYQKPVPLDTAVNSRGYEFNAFVDPDEKYILFSTYGRKGEIGGGDLYISVKDANGKWKHAENLKDLNSRQLEYCPFVSHDGKTLFFTSDRHELPSAFYPDKATVQKIKQYSQDLLNATGNIYWVSFDEIYRKLK